MKQTITNPDFIKDNKRPEGFNRLAPFGINKASFNGDTYSWSSDKGGWFKDTSPEPSPIGEDVEGFELVCKEYNGIYTIRKTKFDLNGLDVAEMTTNQPLDKQKEIGELLASAPTLYRENKELKKELNDLIEYLGEEWDEIPEIVRAKKLLNRI